MPSQQDTNVSSSKTQSSPSSDSFSSPKQNQKQSDMGSGKDLKETPKASTADSQKKSEQW